MKLYVSIIKISEEQVLQMEMNNNSIAGAITFDVPLARGFADCAYLLLTAICDCDNCTTPILNQCCLKIINPNSQ